MHQRSTMVFHNNSHRHRTDIPDIECVVVYRVDEFNSALQKGGQAGRGGEFDRENDLDN